MATWIDVLSKEISNNCEVVNHNLHVIRAILI